MTNFDDFFNILSFQIFVSIERVQSIAFQNLGFELFEKGKDRSKIIEFYRLFIKFKKIFLNGFDNLIGIWTAEFLSNFSHKFFDVVCIGRKILSFSVVPIYGFRNIVVFGEFIEYIPFIRLHFFYLVDDFKRYVSVFKLDANNFETLS